MRKNVKAEILSASAVEHRENDNIDYVSRKKYADMSLEELEMLMLEREKQEFGKINK